MTSKEALTALFTEANRCSCEEPKYTTDILWEMTKLIQKDLEVLEILKYLLNHLEATFNTKHFSDSGIMGTIIKDYFINNDITGKVEEWLENEN